MTEKICTICKIKYLATEEYFYYDKRHKDRFESCCKKCAKKRNQRYYEKSRRNPKTKKKRRELHIKNRYDMTLEQHKQMYVNQNGCCKICKQSTPYSKVNVDHNHETGKVRGLLCYRCNLLLTGIENQEFLQSALKYLEEYSG